MQNLVHVLYIAFCIVISKMNFFLCFPSRHSSHEKFCVCFSFYLSANDTKNMSSHCCFVNIFFLLLNVATTIICYVCSIALC